MSPWVLQWLLLRCRKARRRDHETRSAAFDFALTGKPAGFVRNAERKSCFSRPLCEQIVTLVRFIFPPVLASDHNRRAGLGSLRVEARAVADENLQCDRATGGLKKGASIHVHAVAGPFYLVSSGQIAPCALPPKTA